ncbi:MAG TPA: iron ABC transporter ATP-binding protein [Firmicutes bacterium]|jgi:iron complex transport system ATP-binding protein|nr:iron ABC transporter ATP-binding protein [Bacillota bacterium]
MAILAADQLSAGFGDRTVIYSLSLSIEPGDFLSIIGPNGSGKSTLLKTLSRNLKPQKGSVLLDGGDINHFSAKKLASQLAILHQAPQAPGDLTVRDLVAYGRFPYQNWWQGAVAEDNKVVEWALDQTGLQSLASRQVNTLSGGERQRAWIAMALAQKPRILLLDEPTTYLDICHQLEILDLISRLNQEQKITIVMALHDLNYAARYSDTIAVLSQGSLYASGHPAEVITLQMLRRVFRVEADIWLDGNGRPVCLAQQLTVSI